MKEIFGVQAVCNQVHHAFKSVLIHNGKCVFIHIHISIIKCNDDGTRWDRSSVPDEVHQFGDGEGCVSPLVQCFHLLSKILHGYGIAVVFFAVHVVI